MVTAKKQKQKKRYPGCLAHAVIGMFNSAVANQRQPQHTHNVLQRRCQPRLTIIYIIYFRGALRYLPLVMGGSMTPNIQVLTWILRAAIVGRDFVNFYVNQPVPRIRYIQVQHFDAPMLAISIYIASSILGYAEVRYRYIAIHLQSGSSLIVYQVRFTWEIVFVDFGTARPTAAGLASAPAPCTPSQSSSSSHL